MQIQRPLHTALVKSLAASGFFHKRRPPRAEVGQNGAMQRLLRLAPLLVLLAIGALLAACGGSDLSSDPAKVLADAKLPAAGPAKSTLQLQFTPSSSGGGSSDSGVLGALAGAGIALDATAQGDAATGMTADGKLTLGPVDTPISVRTTKDNAYLQLGGQWYEMGSPLGLDIGSLTGIVGDVSKLVRDPKATAVEDVDGIQCDRITGTINPSASLADTLGNVIENLPIDLSAMANGKATVSIWVGRDDHTIHRVQVDTAAGDTSNGGLLLDISTVPSDPVTVQAPADAKPLSDLLSGTAGKGLGSLLGGLDLGKLLGGGGSGGLDLGKILGGATTGGSA